MTIFCSSYLNTTSITLVSESIVSCIIVLKDRIKKMTFSIMQVMYSEINCDCVILYFVSDEESRHKLC